MTSVELNVEGLRKSWLARKQLAARLNRLAPAGADREAIVDGFDHKQFGPLPDADDDRLRRFKGDYNAAKERTEDAYIRGIVDRLFNGHTGQTERQANEVFRLASNGDDTERSGLVDLFARGNEHTLPNGLSHTVEATWAQYFAELSEPTKSSYYIGQASDLLLSPDRVDAKYAKLGKSTDERLHMQYLAQKRHDTLVDRAETVDVYVTHGALDTQAVGTPADVAKYFENLQQLEGAGATVRVIPSTAGWHGFYGEVAHHSFPESVGVDEASFHLNNGIVAFPNRGGNEVHSSSSPNNFGNSPAWSTIDAVAFDVDTSSQSIGQLSTIAAARAERAAALTQATEVDADLALAARIEGLALDAIDGHALAPATEGIPGWPDERSYISKEALVSQLAIQAAQLRSSSGNAARTVELGADDPNGIYFPAKVAVRSPEYARTLAETPAGSRVLRACERAQFRFDGVDEPTDSERQIEGREAARQLRNEVEAHCMAQGLTLDQLGPWGFRSAGEKLNVDHATVNRWRMLTDLSKSVEHDFRQPIEITSAETMRVSTLDAETVDIQAYTAVPGMLMPPATMRSYLDRTTDMDAEQIQAVVTQYGSIRRGLVERSVQVRAQVDPGALKNFSEQERDSLLDAWSRQDAVDIRFVEPVSRPLSASNETSITRPAHEPSVLTSHDSRLIAHAQSRPARVYEAELFSQNESKRSLDASGSSELLQAMKTNTPDLQVQQFWPNSTESRTINELSRGQDPDEGSGTVSPEDRPLTDPLSSGGAAPAPQPETALATNTVTIDGETFEIIDPATSSETFDVYDVPSHAGALEPMPEPEIDPFPAPKPGDSKLSPEMTTPSLRFS
jgi:hypothetical protein